MIKEIKELFVLCFDETGEILTPDSFSKYWKNYGATGNNLQGWSPPKKIYYGVGQARTGFKYIPDQLKDKVSIYKFIRGEKIISGSEIKEYQQKNYDKKQKEQEEQSRIFKENIRIKSLLKENVDIEFIATKFNRTVEEIKNFK